MFILALLSLLLTACVPARVAQPIPIKQSTDMDLACEQIAIEYNVQGRETTGYSPRR
jgi:hypothetical protein